MAAKRDNDLVPKTFQLSESALTPFMQADFDAAEYLNSTLPKVSFSKPQPSTASSLSELSAETQTLLATLNAQATRLTNLLTQLTDDILRSGGRLAYQVDVLRGETIGLAETLNETLKSDIEIFQKSQNGSSQEQKAASTNPPTVLALTSNDPHYISELHLLTHVKSRLEEVIKVFGSAMAWPAPPSTGIAASFISVSAPPSDEADAKARQYSDTLRSDMSHLIASGDDAAAKAKVEDLKALLALWRGTSEEKGREKFINDLDRYIEDKIRERENGQRRGKARSPPRSQAILDLYP